MLGDCAVKSEADARVRHDGLEERQSTFTDVVEVAFVFETDNLFVHVQVFHVVRGD